TRSNATIAQREWRRSVKRGSPALAYVVSWGDALVAVHFMAFRQVPEHLNAEAAVEVVDDPPLPGTADDLRGEPPDGARLPHDVVLDAVGARDQLLPSQHLVHHSVFQGRRRVDCLTRQQGIGGPLVAEQLLECAVDTVAWHGADSVVQVVDARVFGHQ